MKLALAVVITMIAFAANSVLNRLGVARYGLDPMQFAAIRVAAGACALWLLVASRRSERPTILSRKRLGGAVTLAIYMIGFSWAYQGLDAGVGALILFGALQVVIFGWALVEGQRIALLRWLGMGTAFVGLCVLLWPSDATPIASFSAVAMIAAAIGWGGYTLLGRAENDPLGATASNFLLCVPLVSFGFWSNTPVSTAGIICAVTAGAVTSGMGYALWYRVLPSLQTTMAGIAQLSVPVIAVLFGVALLGETLSILMIISGILVLGGITISLYGQK
ncbi:DMT family transporter [Loktanella sp. S4079]|uniref:DMT family transporter n=1 Tax=Loktanella sp. S4079 TaxID=579483 RepID=UPI0005F9C13E|nr:DMT family transporter [Loktanella sp. S4079]KJZ18291.1 membrane protein [Loktanella sp. S4079]